MPIPISLFFFLKFLHPKYRNLSVEWFENKQVHGLAWPKFLTETRCVVVTYLRAVKTNQMMSGDAGAVCLSSPLPWAAPSSINHTALCQRVCIRTLEGKLAIWLAQKKCPKQFKLKGKYYGKVQSTWTKQKPSCNLNHHCHCYFQEQNVMQMVRQHITIRVCQTDAFEMKEWW